MPDVTDEQIQEAIDSALLQVKQDKLTLEQQKQLSHTLAVRVAEQAVKEYIAASYTIVADLIESGRKVIYLDLPEGANDLFEKALRKRVLDLARGKASIDNNKTPSGQLILRILV